MASGHSGVDHGGQTVKLEDTFTLLESQDLAAVEEISHLILEHMSSGKESWLVNSLVDYYYRTHSVKAKEILVEVREPLDKALMEKLQEGLRCVDTRLQAVQLLLFIVNQQPPWTHRLVERPLFHAFVKCLKTEIDIPILMTGVMALVILLPVVPVGIGSHLQEVFDIFSRIAGLIIKKPGNAPDIFMLHLNVGVYVLFLRLYGMFPCTFTAFLARNYAKKENLMVYSEVVAPILEKVRLHPNLVLGSKSAETDKSRWRKVEPQDIVVNCAKMSLDPIEGTREDQRCPITPRPHPAIITSMKLAIAKLERQPQDPDWREKLERVQAMFPVVEDPASYKFSPSQLLGLATPPPVSSSQRNATPPTFSFHHESSYSLQQSAGGTVPASPQLVTPTPEATPREMPVGEELQAANTTLSSAKTTPVPPRVGGGPKTTPVAGARTQTTSSTSSSAFTSPFTFNFRPPVVSQPPSTAPSPMKPNLSSDSLSSQAADTGATTTRALFFDRIPESTEEGVPRHIEMRMSKDCTTWSGAARSVPMESLPSIVRDLSSQDNDTLDQEVSSITQAEESYDSATPGGKEEVTSASVPKHLDTPESVIKYMKQVNRIRFNSLTSQSEGEAHTYVHDKHAPPGRSRSCPPLHRKPVGGDLPGPSPRSHATLPHSKLDTVSESAVSMDTKCVAMVAGVGERGRLFASQFSQDWSGGSRGSEASSVQQNKVCTCHHKMTTNGPGGGDGGGGGRDDRWPSGVAQEMGWVFQSLLAPVRVAVCRQCHRPLLPADGASDSPSSSGGGEGAGGGGGEGRSAGRQGQSPGGAGSWISWPVGERALYSVLSPPELLDRHLTQGSELHSKELSHIPLTSQESISWTHFGGGPPVDEVNILRGEILLLHNQVLYERHKRSNHAMRNRRLLRRIAHVSALEEQVQALTDQLSGRAKDIQNLQVSLKLLQDHNHRLQQAADSDLYEKLVDFKTTIQQNKDLQEANIELKNLLLTQKAENDELKKELQEVRAQCFELEKDNQLMSRDMDTAKKWQEQVDQLQKEMLLMGEAHERLQNLLDQQRKVGQENITLSNNALTRALKAEVKDLYKDKADLTRKLDASQCRLINLDDFAKGKDITIAKLKTNFEVSKAAHAEELKAVQSKYQSMVYTNQELQSHILRLQADANCLQQKLASASFHCTSRRHSDHPDRGGSPQAEAGVMHSSSSPLPTTTSTTPDPSATQPPEKTKGASGEECSELGSDPHTPPRPVSQLSKDSGRGSMLTSSHFLPTHPASESTPSDPSAKAGCSSSSSSSKPSGSGRKETFPKGKRKKSPEQQVDAGSELSDGGQVFIDSRTMLNTDSEDNGSQSSNSIFTADSGVYSKVDHTH